MKAGALATAAAALLLAAPALAQEERFCPNRPSLGASGCTVLPGQVLVELSGIDWQRERGEGERTDTILFGDAILRTGLDEHTEVQLGWTPLAIVRTRDVTSGAVRRRSGVGDVRLAVRRSFSGADGHRLSAAIEPFVVLPTSSNGVGDGTWSAGAVLPVYYELPGGWSVDFTGEVSALADEDGRGRHADVSGVVGVGYDISDAVTATAEFYAERDADPAHHATVLLAAGSMAWQPGRRTQIDLLAAAGLNHDAPDVRIVVGGAVLF